MTLRSRLQSWLAGDVDVPVPVVDGPETVTAPPAAPIESAEPDPVSVPSSTSVAPAPVMARAANPRRLRREDDPAPDLSETCGGCAWWLVSSDGATSYGYCRFNPARVRTIARDWCSRHAAR